MSRKKFTLVSYGVVGDYQGQPPLILPGHHSIDEVRALQKLDRFARAHRELPVVFSVMSWLLYPPGASDAGRTEDADEADLAYLQNCVRETGTVVGCSAWVGGQSATIYDYYNGAQAEETEECMSGKRLRFSMVVYSTEGDFLHEKVLLLPGTVTIQQARLRPEVKEFAAQHPDDPTVFSCSILLFRAPNVAADAPIVDATRESIRTIRLFHPEAPGSITSGVFQRVENEADILIGGNNPYYHDPEEETEEER